MSRFLKKLLALSMAKGCLTAQAQSTESRLDPVNITASLQPAPASQTGRSIVVIKGSQLPALPVHTIDDLLRFLPGVEVQQRGPFGAGADIVIRGGTFQQVLVVLDGLRLNDPNTGHFNAYIPIALPDIERIEILKGAASALWGSEAVGGVIHIITKTFAAAPNQRTRQLTASAAMGNNGLFTANAGASVQSATTAFSGGLTTNNTGGIEQRGIRSFAHNHTASLAFKSFLPGNWSLALQTAYDRRNFAAQNFYTTFLSDTATESVHTWWNALALARETGRQHFGLNLGYKQVQDQFRYNPSSTANQNTSRLFQARALYRRTIAAATTFSCGLQATQKAIESNDRGNHKQWQAAAFGVLNTNLGENLLIAPAVRLEWARVWNLQLLPQLNLSYHIGKAQLRGSVGKSIRDADFTERYNNYNKALVTGGSIGNPALTPEKAWSYELGADYQPAAGLRLSATAFQRKQEDLVDWVTTPYASMPRQQNLLPAGSYALATNLARVTTTGIETTVQASRHWKSGSIWSTIGVQWIHSTSTETQPSFYLLSHAKWLVTGDAVFTRRRWQVSVNGLVKVREPIQSQTLPGTGRTLLQLNAKASWNLKPEALSFFAELLNLTGEQDRDLLTATQPARWFSAGLTWQGR